MLEKDGSKLAIKFPAVYIADPDFLRSFEVVCNEQYLLAYSDDSVWMKMDDDGVNVIYTVDTRKPSVATH
jgi:hypothetical protein